MIALRCGQPGDPTIHVVRAALIRALSAGQITEEGEAEVMFFVGAADSDAPAIEECLIAGGKVIVLGHMPQAVAPLFGLDAPQPLPAGYVAALRCAPAQTFHSSASAAQVHWTAAPFGAVPPLASYPALRFDFTDEWNNLGYGALRGDGSMWALSRAVAAPHAQVLAEVRAPNLNPLPYVTLHRAEKGAALWWNRPVGPVDHPDWALLENFLSEYGAADRLPCLPILEELPYGASAAVTMRLDCDEDVESARALFEFYRNRNRPLSLAIMTGQPEQDAHVALMRDTARAGGSVVPHSATHAPRWGGSLAACRDEIIRSRDWITQRLDVPMPRYVVSPFHHAPAFLPTALAQTEMRGFVGGIISDDPEMLVARGGGVIGPYGVSGQIITHTQQCMLHGDCQRSDASDTMIIPKTAFDTALRARSLFGYLDHPISPRYDYGWSSFKAQIKAHHVLMAHIDAVAPNALWLNLTDALDWLHARAQVTIVPSTNGWQIHAPQSAPKRMRFGLRYKGTVHPIEEFIDV